jgi:hypothetical protein
MLTVSDDIEKIMIEPKLGSGRAARSGRKTIDQAEKAFGMFFDAAGNHDVGAWRGHGDFLASAVLHRAEYKGRIRTRPKAGSMRSTEAMRIQSEPAKPVHQRGEHMRQITGGNVWPQRTRPKAILSKNLWWFQYRYAQNAWALVPQARQIVRWFDGILSPPGFDFARGNQPVALNGDRTFERNHPSRSGGAPLLVAIAIAVLGVLGILIVDHGPWSKPKVQPSVIANYSTTGEAARWLARESDRTGCKLSRIHPGPCPSSRQPSTA